MTDHHDDLASAYLDGQLSPDEAARVESDPQLMAEVDALAGVVEGLQTEEAPVSSGTRERHLAAALAIFDRAGADDAGVDPADLDLSGIDPAGLDRAALDASSAPTNVIRLDTSGGRSGSGDPPTQRYPRPDDMARRTARVASAPAGRDEIGARRASARRRQGLPSWLSTAAALLILGGGIGWYVSRQSQSDDTAASTAAMDSAQEGGASDAALSQTADSDAAALAPAGGEETAKADVEDAAGGAGEPQQAVPAIEATTAAGAGGPATTAVAPSTTTSRALTTAAPAGGLSFSATPTGPEVQARLTSAGQSPQPAEGSACGGSVTPPAGTSLTGYVPVTVAGVPGEALFYRDGAGPGDTTVLVVRTSSCQVFS